MVGGGNGEGEMGEMVSEWGKWCQGGNGVRGNGVRNHFRGKSDSIRLWAGREMVPGTCEKMCFESRGVEMMVGQ